MFNHKLAYILSFLINSAWLGTVLWVVNGWMGNSWAWMNATSIMVVLTLLAPYAMFFIVVGAIIDNILSSGKSTD